MRVEIPINKIKEMVIETTENNFCAISFNFPCNLKTVKIEITEGVLDFTNNKKIEESRGKFNCTVTPFLGKFDIYTAQFVIANNKGVIKSRFRSLSDLKFYAIFDSDIDGCKFKLNM